MFLSQMGHLKLKILGMTFGFMESQSMPSSEKSKFSEGSSTSTIIICKTVGGVSILCPFKPCICSFDQFGVVFFYDF